MIGKALQKLRSLFDGSPASERDSGASERMPEEWAEDLENAEQLEPGRDIQAGQIGMFS